MIFSSPASSPSLGKGEMTVLKGMLEGLKVIGEAEVAMVS